MSTGHRELPRAVILMAMIGGASMPLAPCIGQEAATRPEVFNQCSVCHSTDGSNGTGPTLKGLFGRQAGTFLGFRYSGSMRVAGIVWDAKGAGRLSAQPAVTSFRETSCHFPVSADSAERAGLIAYLRSLK